MNEFEKTINNITHQKLCCRKIDTLQINIGLRCNQQCHHCHLKSTPDRTEMMTWSTMKNIMNIADDLQYNLVDVTGGASEGTSTIRRTFVAAADQDLSPVWENKHA